MCVRSRVPTYFPSKFATRSYWFSQFAPLAVPLTGPTKPRRLTRCETLKITHTTHPWPFPALLPRPRQETLQLSLQLLLRTRLAMRVAGSLRMSLLRSGMKKLLRILSRSIGRAMASLLHTLRPQALDNLTFLLGEW